MWGDKPLSEVIADDINRLLTDGSRETDQIEFKQELPSKSPSAGWMTGDNRVEAYGRDRVLQEVVALANTSGGYLIIGIEESDDGLARAVGIRRIPRCKQLAAKLHEQADACIEPRVPGLQVSGVLLEPGSDDGVVVFHVQRSPMAPHRLESSRECYVRRGARSVPMTMQEIQNVTLTTRRQEVEGLWTAQFEGDNGGVVILDEGMVLGGDAQFYYDGRYEITSNDVWAEFRVTHYHGDRTSLYGDRQAQFTVVFRGKRDGPVVSGEMRRTGFPPARCVLIRRANLP